MNLGKVLLTSLCAFATLSASNSWSFGTKEKSEAQAATAGSSSSSENIWVKRSDFGVSCEKDKAQSLEAGADDLKKAGIQVFESGKGADSKMHIQVCGAPSGNENRYLISKSEIEKAKALGFKEVPSAPKH